MYALDASRIIRNAWRTSPAISESGQDVGLVVGFLKDFCQFLKYCSLEQKVVVIFSEYAPLGRIEPDRFNRFYPRNEAELQENYSIMKQFLFSIFDYLPFYAINSKSLTDFDCMHLLRHVNEEDEFNVFAPFEEFCVFDSNKQCTSLYGDDFIKRNDGDWFSEKNLFAYENSALFYALFGGRYSNKIATFQKKTAVKMFPELAKKRIEPKDLFSFCSGLDTENMKNIVLANRDKIEESYGLYLGSLKVKEINKKAVTEYLSKNKKFSYSKFVTAIYRLGVYKHLKQEIDEIEKFSRSFSDFGQNKAMKRGDS